MPGIAGIVFVLVLAVIIAAWTIWVTGRTEQPKDGGKENPGEHKPSLPDT